MRTHVWRMNKSTALKFYELMSHLEFTEPETEEWWALSEEIASLPGHPKSEFGDIILHEVTSVQH